MMSIATYCAQNQCPTYPPPLTGPCGLREIDMNCGGYIAVNDHGVDFGTVSYYDRKTGQLVAVVSFNANGGGSMFCDAGPTDGFVPPQCSGTSMNVCDAGTD